MAHPAEPNHSVHEDEPPSPSDVAADLECVEWCPICRTADIVRTTAPPELRGQWHTVQREALMTARALIDSYLERLEQAERQREPWVEEIPIE